MPQAVHMHLTACPLTQRHTNISLTIAEMTPCSFLYWHALPLLIAAFFRLCAKTASLVLVLNPSPHLFKPFYCSIGVSTTISSRLYVFQINNESSAFVSGRCAPKPRASRSYSIPAPHLLRPASNAAYGYLLPFSSVFMHSRSIMSALHSFLGLRAKTARLALVLDPGFPTPQHSLYCGSLSPTALVFAIYTF